MTTSCTSIISFLTALRQTSPAQKNSAISESSIGVATLVHFLEALEQSRFVANEQSAEASTNESEKL